MANYELRAKACELARSAHEGQMYGERPYYEHLAAVVDSVFDFKEDDEHICVAWLHDILEDTAITEYDLILIFGYKIADAVVALTKVKGEKYSEYLDKVAANEIALTVKLHDTYCNLSESLKTQQWGRVRKYSAQMKLLAVYK